MWEKPNPGRIRGVGKGKSARVRGFEKKKILREFVGAEEKNKMLREFVGASKK